MGCLLVLLLHFFLIPALALADSRSNNNRFYPDCDDEWATRALEAVERKESDPMRLRHIHAILQSCNKAQLQKMAEVSVFLFEKGTYPNPQVMQELSRLSENARDEKLNRLLRMRSNLPEHLHQSLGQLATIHANGSLSGNEKAIVISRLLQALDDQDRSQLEQVLSTARAGTLQTASRKINVEYGPSPMIANSQNRPTTETHQSRISQGQFGGLLDGEDRQTNMIEKSNQGQQFGGFKQPDQPDSPLNLFGAGVPSFIAPKVPKPPIIRPSSTLNMNSQRSDESTEIGEPLFGVDKKTPQNSFAGKGNGLKRLFTEGEENTSDRVNQEAEKFFDNDEGGDEERPLFVSGRRPFSVGEATKDKDMMPIVPINPPPTIPPDIPDPDLMTSKPSVWTDAAKLLQESTNIPNRIGKFINEAVKHPERLAKRLGETLQQKNTLNLPLNLGIFPDIETEDHRAWLPSRRSDQPPIVPVNQPNPNQANVQMGLDRFDTNLDRFSSNGPANRFVLGAMPNFGGQPGGLGLGLPGQGLNQPNPFAVSQTGGLPQQMGSQWMASQMANVGIPGGLGMAGGLPGVPPGNLAGGLPGGLGNLQPQLAGQFGGMLPTGLTETQVMGGMMGGNPLLAGVPNQQQSAAATAQMINSAYTFPVTGLQRGQKFLQNLPTWTPMPPVGGQQQFPGQQPFAAKAKMNGVQTFQTYPDHRQGLFPELRLQGEIHKPLMGYGGVTDPPSYRKGLFSKEINQRIDHQNQGTPEDLRKYARPGETVYLETYPEERKDFRLPRPQVIGDDLSETDPKGSVPMGRYGKEGYEPLTIRPPIQYETTTILAVPQQRWLPAEGSQLIGFPDKRPVTNPPIRRYEGGPEEITGSHLRGDHYNVRQYGQNRYVKIDINPTESVVG